MVVPHLRCRSQCFEFMRVGVEVQPDREHAKRDDAGVDVAAHFLTIPRYLSLWSQAAVLGVQWHLTPSAHRAAIYAQQWYVKQHRCLVCFCAALRLTKASATPGAG